MTDSAPETTPVPAPVSSIRLIATLGGIALFSGMLLAMTYELTKPIIAHNHSVALEAAVLRVLPGAVSRENYLLTEDGLQKVEDAENANLFAGVDADGRRVGFALSGEARGYADVVRILYGFDPEANLVIGMTVLQSTETPGLGDRIIRDEDFHANFKALDVSREVEVVKSGEKEHPWQIDGITGATVSSQAVGQAIRGGAGLRTELSAYLTDPTDQTDPSEEDEI